MDSIEKSKVKDLEVNKKELTTAEKYIEELIDDIVKKNIENFNKKN